MTDRIFLFFTNAKAAHADLLRLWAFLKPLLLVGQRFELEVRPERRSSEANAKLHAELGEISESVEWAGRLRDTETWKRLMTAAWLRARGESVEILPALDGYGVDVVFRRTSTLSKAEMGELIEYVSAWKAENMQTT